MTTFLSLNKQPEITYRLIFDSGFIILKDLPKPANKTNTIVKDNEIMEYNNQLYYHTIMKYNWNLPKVKSKYD